MISLVFLVAVSGLPGTVAAISGGSCPVISDTIGFCVVCTLCLNPLSQTHIPHANTVDVAHLETDEGPRLYHAQQFCILTFFFLCIHLTFLKRLSFSSALIYKPAQRHISVLHMCVKSQLNEVTPSDSWSLEQKIGQLPQ